MRAARLGGVYARWLSADNIRPPTAKQDNDDENKLAK